MIALDTPDLLQTAFQNERPAAIEVGHLWKKYGKIEAVRGIDLAVKQGEIFGLIGPDGAGKTTTFQILGGVMEATSGSAKVFGRAAREARSETGLSDTGVQPLCRPQRCREPSLHRRFAAGPSSGN